MTNSVLFARLMEEHGNLETELEQDDQPRLKRKDKDGKVDNEAELSKKADTALMQLEERNTGAVTWSIYRKYLRYAGSVAWAPFILFLLTLSQVAQGISNSLQGEQGGLIRILIQLAIICSLGFGRRVAYRDLHREII